MLKMTFGVLTSPLPDPQTHTRTPSANPLLGHSPTVVDERLPLGPSERKNSTSERGEVAQFACASAGLRRALKMDFLVLQGTCL